MTWSARLDPRWILLAGWLGVIAYAYPGYMNWDADEQLYQARIHELEDWHPPLMGMYWRWIEVVIHGPFGMLVLQTSLFMWGLYAALSLRFSSRTSAVVAVVLAWFPPVLTPMAPVWKDAQMAGFLIAGTMLAMRGGRWRSILGCVLLFFAVGVRDNGAAALPPLCLLIAGSWGLRRRAFTWGAAIAMFVVIVLAARFANTCATDRRVYPWFKTVAIHDIAGTMCFADPLTDDEVRELLKGVPLRAETNLQARLCEQYNPRIWLALSFGDRTVFLPLPERSERLARRDAWKRLVTQHTHAYLTHRWSVMREVLGLTDLGPWEPACQTFAANEGHLRRVQHDASHSWLQRHVGGWFQTFLANTMWYRPWVYAVIAIILGVYAFRRNALVFALCGSGLLYEASLFVAAASPDFRYSHWMITCTCLAVAIVFGERYRSGRHGSTRPPDVTATRS